MKELKNEKLEQVVGGGANSRRIYCPECNKYVKPVWN